MTGSARLPLTVAWPTKQVIVMTSLAALLVIVTVSTPSVVAVTAANAGDAASRRAAPAAATRVVARPATRRAIPGRVGDEPLPGVWSGVLSVVWVTMPA